MDKKTYEALKRLVKEFKGTGFYTDNKNTFEPDVSQVEGWIDEYAKEVE